MAQNTHKIIQSMVYLACHQKDKKLDFMKAYKLLWLSDRCHLRMFGRTITGDKYFAMTHGIVPTDAKHLLEGEPTLLSNSENYFNSNIKVVGKHTFQAINDPDLNEFSDSDIKVLNRVLTEFNAMKPKELSDLSHKYPEWLQYQELINDKSNKSSFPVNVDLFFENSTDDHAMIFDQSPELLEVTKDLYHEYYR